MYGLNNIHNEREARRPLFFGIKTPPRQYEAGAENARNIRAIYGDGLKPYEIRLFNTKCRLQRTKSKGQIEIFSKNGVILTAASLAGRAFCSFRRFPIF